MSKEICISSTPHETRLAIIEDEQLTEVYYERENEYTLAGSIYKGRVTRVLPGMQSAFVDVGLERDAFLYVTDFLEEQEDSADFERLPGNGRQENRQHAPREPKAAAAAPEAEGETKTPAAGEEFVEGTRRWRGRRGRRGRGARPGSGLASGSTASQPSQEHPPAHEESEQAVEPLAEARTQDAPLSTDRPVFLPGESLSKYGGHGAGKEAAPAEKTRESRPAAAVSFSKPSTLIETPLQWDGGSLLPGESISRYRETPGENVSAKEPVAAVQPHTEMPFDSSQQREEHAGAAEQSAPEEIAESVAEIPHSSLPPAEGKEELFLEEQLVVAEDPAEFEEASASHRIDPSAPSEFRIFPSPSDVVEDPEEASFPAIPEIERHFSQSPEENGPAAAQEPHFDFTSEQDEEDAEEDIEALMEELHASASPAGLVEEEEVSEEEEYDFAPIYHAADDHDLEDMEEETLDREAAGAEIEELVRDTHIDQRVGAGSDGLTIEDSAGVDDDEDESDDESEAELTESAPASGASQPAQRGRQDQRRGGRGNRQSGRRPNGRRQSAQSSDLPAISELLKQGQEILVQIAKEPIAKKGARITSHIALPGRFLVFMPTVNHVGVSRKISSDEERHRLKRILISEKGDGGGGFIVRTAADGASEEDLRADIRFLISLWAEIKQRADAGKAPALIYHDLNLVERILRDQVSDNFSTIWVDTESEYERIVRFLNRFQPSLVRRVKLYTKETPLFEQFGIQDEIGKALKSKVWLKSGGSIVINQTEALVAIDINTGKYVGKTARLEDTILKTNLDAIPEIVRQIRLRDLGGIIVIDFIDMDERKNRHKVMQALEEALKADRAPSKVLQFNDFGLVAITRKRVKQSLERTLCVPCSICTGTGMVKGPTTVCNEIYVEMRKMQRHLERQDVLLRVHPEVVKALKGSNARWLSELEEMSGKTIIVKSDPALPPEQFDIH